MLPVSKPYTNFLSVFNQSPITLFFRCTYSTKSRTIRLNEASASAPRRTHTDAFNEIMHRAPQRSRNPAVVDTVTTVTSTPSVASSDSTLTSSSPLIPVVDMSNEEPEEQQISLGLLSSPQVEPQSIFAGVSQYRPQLLSSTAYNRRSQLNFLSEGSSDGGPLLNSIRQTRLSLQNLRAAEVENRHGRIVSATAEIGDQSAAGAVVRGDFNSELQQRISYIPTRPSTGSVPAQFTPPPSSLAESIGNDQMSLIQQAFFSLFQTGLNTVRQIVTDNGLVVGLVVGAVVGGGTMLYFLRQRNDNGGLLLPSVGTGGILLQHTERGLVAWRGSTLPYTTPRELSYEEVLDLSLLRKLGLIGSVAWNLFLKK